MDEDAEETKLTMVVMRDESTGMVESHICERKGRNDGWIVNRLVDDIEAWGYTVVVLKSDGEPAMQAIETERGSTVRYQKTLPHTRRKRTVWQKEQCKK